MITREELYRLVWSQSGVALAATLGISDSYLKRVCTALDIPRPEPGWWNKHKAGHAPAPALLPAARPGRPTSWSKAASGGPPIRPHYRRNDLLHPPVSDGTHLLVAQAEELFKTASLSADGTLLQTNWRYHAIDLTTSNTGLVSCIQFANSLFVELEKRGHLITLASEHGIIRPPISNWRQNPTHFKLLQPDRTPIRPTIVNIGGVQIGLAILEVFEEAEMLYVGGGTYVPARSHRSAVGISWTEWRRKPTGRLKLAAYSPYYPLPWLREWTEARNNTFARKSKTMALTTELELAAAEYGTVREANDLARSEDRSRILLPREY